jgi:hypothetical protein
MPTRAEILAGLREIANRGADVAVAWHVVLAIALIALAAGWRPSRRAAGALLALPLLSVAGFATGFGNPFNGLLLAAGALAVFVLAGSGDRAAVARGPAWAWWTGAALIAYGWVYPHFLDAPAVTYLYAAPLGLVPCPTLSVVIGLALLGGGLGMRAWTLTLAGLGLFYGVFGVLRLGVLLDVGLVAGAVALAATALVGHVAPTGWPGTAPGRGTG